MSQSSIFRLVAYIEYGFYGLCLVLSVVSLVYHLSKKCKGGDLVPVNAAKAGSPEVDPEIENDSIHKLESKSSKRSRIEQPSPILENI